MRGAEHRHVRMLRHGRIDLALWDIRPGDGTPLLLLHGLGEESPPRVPLAAARWPGPVLGLDFTGHGASSVAVGGGYTSESLVGDTDTVLREVGAASLWGRGLGGYIALLIAGIRPEQVRGIVIDDGPGLAGGGVEPGSPVIVRPAEVRTGTPDPYALVELARDVRPADYAATFTRCVLEAGSVDDPVMVAARIRPPWLAAVAAEPGVVEVGAAEGLARLARS